MLTRAAEVRRLPLRGSWRRRELAARRKNTRLATGELHARFFANYSLRTNPPSHPGPALHIEGAGLSPSLPQVFLSRSRAFLSRSSARAIRVSARRSLSLAGQTRYQGPESTCSSLADTRGSWFKRWNFRSSPETRQMLDLQNRMPRTDTRLGRVLRVEFSSKDGKIF